MGIMQWIYTDYPPPLTQEPRCPVATMDPFACECLAQCHAVAHHRSVKAGSQPVPCLYCERDYPWHVLEGVYWRKPAAQATPLTATL